MPPTSADQPSAAEAADPPSWAALLDVDRLAGDDADAAGWRDADLAAILRHQLACGLRCALDVLNGQAAADLVRDAAADETFASLLVRPDPPAELLDLVRQFGKAVLSGPGALVPREVGTVLYYASILAARQRCARRISALSDEALARGVESVLGWGWVDGLARALLSSGQSFLRGVANPERP